MRLQASLDLKRAKQYARLDKNKELDLKVDVEEQPDKTPEYDKNKEVEAPTGASQLVSRLTTL